MSRTTVVVTPGVPGSRSPARVRVETDGPRGRAHLAARLLGVRGEVVRIALVAEGALLLAGDDVEVRLRVGEGCRLEVTEPAGTVAYDMRGGAASWRVAVDVETGGEVVWCGEPFVVAGGADVLRTLTVRLAGTATARLREVLVLGRFREQGGRIRQRTEVTRDGFPVHLEQLDLDGSRPRVGLLGDLRVIDTVSVLGRRAPGIPVPTRAHRLDLEAEATLIRSLGAQTHLASLEAVWSAIGPPDAPASATAPATAPATTPTTTPTTTVLPKDSRDARPVSSTAGHSDHDAGVGRRPRAPATP